jgi:hypothetical protein
VETFNIEKEVLSMNWEQELEKQEQEKNERRRRFEALFPTFLRLLSESWIEAQQFLERSPSWRLTRFWICPPSFKQDCGRAKNPGRERIFVSSLWRESCYSVAVR